MRRYETIFILRPSLNEEEINSVVDNTCSLITEVNGKIIELDRWGMRKLAYPIKKEYQGFYVLLDYSGTPEAVAEMERKFRIDDSVLRYMTVKISDDISDEEITQATDLAVNRKAELEKEQEGTPSPEADVADTSSKTEADQSTETVES